MVSAVRETLEHLDILAFVPQSEAWPVAMEDDGIHPVDHSYRDEMDSIFKQIYRGARFDVLPIKSPPLLIELVGSPERRLLQLAQVVEQVRVETRRLHRAVHKQSLLVLFLKPVIGFEPTTY